MQKSPKILVLQLARFGDIILSGLALWGLKKKYPDSSITLVVRPTFRAAADLLGSVDDVLELPELSIFDWSLKRNDERVIENLYRFLDRSELNQQWDEVFDFSFSPISSHLTFWLSPRSKKVRGYSRHVDGHFNPTCDVSAYFYSQVGPQRPNRAHLSSIFAALAEVDVGPKDWESVLKETDPDLFSDALFKDRRDCFILHPFASESCKEIPVSFWTHLIQKAPLNQFKWMMVGGQSDVEASMAIEQALKQAGVHIQNLTGKTSFQELQGLLKDGRGLIAGDTVSTHLANCVNCPVFQLSLAKVNFFETGPLSDGSAIYFQPNKEDFEPNQVAIAFGEWLSESRGGGDLIYFSGNWPIAFDREDLVTADFQWSLIKAIYMGEDFPLCDELNALVAFRRLSEVCDLAIDQIRSWEQLTPAENSEKLEVIDQLILAIEHCCPNISPLVRWFQTERIRLIPSSLDETLTNTYKLYEKLKAVCELYRIPADKDFLSASEASSTSQG